MSSSTRALARIARRSIFKAPLRSLLVVVLIALLVAVGTGAAVIMRSTTASADDYRLGAYGQANTLITINPLQNSPNLIPNGSVGFAVPSQVAAIRSVDGEPVRFETVEEERAFIAKAREDALAWIEDFEATNGIERIRELAGDDALIHRRGFANGQRNRGPFGSYGGSESTRLIDIDMSHPLAEGLLELAEGRYPRSDNEVTIGLRRARSTDVDIGDLVRVADQQFTVVGIAAEPSSTSAEFMIVVPAVMDRAEFEPFDLEYRVRANIAPRDRVEVLTAIEDIVGFDVSVRIVEGVMFKDPAGAWVTRTGSELQLFPNSADRAAARLVPIVVSVALGTQIALVAAVAFAVGIRRRTREFGQLATTGADQQQIRRLVLLEAGWLGLAGAVVGLAVGLIAADRVLNLTWVSDFGSRYALETRWRVVDLIGPPLIGIGAALVAAWWPSRLLAKASPSAALAGHLPEGRPHPYTPRLGVVLIVGGVLAMAVLTGINFVGQSAPGVVLMPLLWIGSVLVAFLGLLMLIGALLSLIGRRADRLPLLARLVTRNADRQRARSWVVVGAFIATLVIPTLIGASTKAYPESYGATKAELGERAVIMQAFPGPGDPQTSTEAIAQIEAIEPDFASEAAAVIGEFERAPLVTAPAQITFTHGPHFATSYGTNTLWVATPELLALLNLPADLIDDLDSNVVYDIGAPIRVGDADTVLSGLTGSAVSPVSYVRGPTVMSRSGVMLVSTSLVDRFGLTATRAGAVYVSEESISEKASVELAVLANGIWTDRYGAFAPDIDPNRIWYSELNLDVNHEYSAGPTAGMVRLIALAVSAGLAALIALATGSLSAVELDGEVRSMIATGAEPSVRRKLLGAQTLYYLVMAAVLGIPFGLLLFNVVVRIDDFGPTRIIIPWSVVAVVLFVIPAIVAAFIALLFRNGTPAISRRLS